MKKNNKVTKRSKALSEFSNFILRGNVIDLAVGIIIGGAFNKIVSSLVGDILTPVLSIFTSTVSFDNLKIPLSFLKNLEETPTINIGVFISAVIDFLIMAIVVFCLVKGFNKIKIQADSLLKPKEEKEDKEEPKKTTKDCPFCLSQIHIEATRCPHCTSEIKPQE